MQSVPAQGQTPQTFETSADILAKADWNALPVQTGVPWVPKMGDVDVCLQGTATQLQPGDAILIVGDERKKTSTDPHWDLRIVTSVVTDTTSNRTTVTWSAPLGDKAAKVAPASANPAFYALRQRASLIRMDRAMPEAPSAGTLGASGASPLWGSVAEDRSGRAPLGDGWSEDRRRPPPRPPTACTRPHAPCAAES